MKFCRVESAPAAGGLRYYFIRDYKNARKGHAKPRDKFLLCLGEGSPGIKGEDARGKLLDAETRSGETMYTFAVPFTNFPRSV